MYIINAVINIQEIKADVVIQLNAYNIHLKNEKEEEINSLKTIFISLFLDLICSTSFRTN